MESRILKGDVISMSFFQGEYTIEDIYALPDGQRAELFDGKMVMLATPNRIHQEILGWLCAKLYEFIKSRNGNCKVYPAPFAVLLKKDDRTYLEPDISVICDRDKLDDKGCNGAPDFTMEIVSPSSKKIDYYRKLTEYSESGVREYWIIDPMKQVVVVYNLQEKEAPVFYHFTDTVESSVLPGFSADFSELEEDTNADGQ